MDISSNRNLCDFKINCRTLKHLSKMKKFLFFLALCAVFICTACDGLNKAKRDFFREKEKVDTIIVPAEPTKSIQEYIDEAIDTQELMIEDYRVDSVYRHLSKQIITAIVLKYPDYDKYSIVYEYESNKDCYDELNKSSAEYEKYKKRHEIKNKNDTDTLTTYM